jgi:hypothetical protein
MVRRQQLATNKQTFILAVCIIYLGQVAARRSSQQKQRAMIVGSTGYGWCPTGFR